MRDLTAVLLPKGQVPDESIEKTVLGRGYGDIYLRIAPLDAVKLVQVEVMEAGDGRPALDPELVQRLSVGGKAAFVHVNHEADQAICHPFVNGVPLEGWMGKPGDELEKRLRELWGHPLAELIAADDGTRQGFGITSSRTKVYVYGQPGREVPRGFPTGLDSFRFHDRGGGLPASLDRLAFFAYDRREAGAMLSRPGREIPAWLESRKATLGPLAALLPSVMSEFEALGERAPKDAQCSVRALELVALASARVYATGESLTYWDDRVLPIAFLSAAPPSIDADDVAELAECKSVWHAIVEVLPYSAPEHGEGAILAQIGDEELGPLSPWAKSGEEYQGAIFILNPKRILNSLREVTRESIEELEHRFVKAWYEAAGSPANLQEWANGVIASGMEDQSRVLSCLAELRTCLEYAVGNDLQVALLFYEAQV